MKKVLKLLISKIQAAYILDCAYEKIDSLIRNNEHRLFSDRNNGLNSDKIYLGDIERKLKEYEVKQKPLITKITDNIASARAVIKSFLANPNIPNLEFVIIEVAKTVRKSFLTKPTNNLS